MSQFINGECSSSSLATDDDTKELNTIPSHDGSNESQQQIHHIPIYVEGRNEPVLNRFSDQTDSAASSFTHSRGQTDSAASFAHSRGQTDSAASFAHSRASSNDIPKHGSIFSRVKEIPVKSFIPNFESSRRSASPARNIPINVDKQHYHHHQKQHHQQQQQPHMHSQNQNFQKSSSPVPTKPIPVDPITKIQSIQREMLDLMDKVEKFEGGSRQNKEYIYLDEMLTQNLLKLDTIDTEGKDNIKAARKEVINCINKCICVLEAKANGTSDRT